MSGDNQLLKLKIEKLSNLGLGIARKEGQVIFVGNSCPGDEIEAKLIHTNRNYSIAEISRITEPSPHRIAPLCPLQKICGSCQLQFIDYEYQLKLKRQIVEDTMRNIAGTSFEIREVIPSPKQWGCRRKIQYSVRSSKKSNRLKIGYYQNRSHNIVNIKHCPIQPEVCDRIVDYIRENSQKFSVSGFDENAHSGDLRHVIMRSSSLDEKILLTLVINSKTIHKNVTRLAEEIFNSFPEISGVCTNLNDLKSNLILSDKTECLCGESFIREEICGIKFLVGTNTFFQVNPKSAENIFKFVTDHISKDFREPEILDAYAGISAFGFVLANVAKSVTSVEECRESVELAEKVKKINGISNVELNHMDAGEFFRQSLENGRKFDIIVLDPPRKGCSEESLTYAVQLARKQIIYVSCNPATLARDLKFLTTLGSKVRFIQPFDMFCHTYHVESVAIIDMI